MVEDLKSLFQTELIRSPAVRPVAAEKSRSDVGIAVAEMSPSRRRDVDGFDHGRLHAEI